MDHLENCYSYKLIRVDENNNERLLTEITADHVHEKLFHNHTYIFILKCEDDKYYVGKTTTLLARLNCYFRGEGSEWTKKYKPLQIVQIVLDDGEKEKIMTLRYMRKYGWQNVRGYTWNHIEMKKPPKEI